MSKNYFLGAATKICRHIRDAVNFMHPLIFLSMDKLPANSRRPYDPYLLN